MSRVAGLDLEYNYKLARSTNYGNYRSTNNIKYIVIHYTANNGDTDTGNGSYFSREKTGTSAHYFVDEDSCTQAVPDNRIGYHCETKGMTFKCGCRNINSIGIEMCSDIVNGQYIITQQTKLNTVTLTKWLMKKYNIPTSMVIRHWDVCGKECPKPWIGNDNSEWKDFKNKLEENDMTTEEVKKIATQMANDLIYEYVTSKKEPVYQTYSEVPDWGKSTVKKLMDKGALKGSDKGLDLSYSLLRQLVINDRIGLYN